MIRTRETTQAAQVPATRDPEIKKQLAQVAGIVRDLERVTKPEDIRAIEVKLDAIEGYMRAAGLYQIDEIRPVNEARMRARWKLGKALAKQERGKAPGKGKMIATSLQSFFARLGLTSTTATAAQRLGAMPASELDKVLAEARERDRLASYDELIVRARPYWYKANREVKHRAIHIAAASTAAAAPLKDGPPGPYPLIYADPPWKFEIYSEKGLERTPDQHYPTLSDDEIFKFRVNGHPMSTVAHRDAALFLWCTSSNVHRALEVMRAWDFEFKSSAVWVKDKSGLGLVFRNQHELLLYGTRGKMPGPQYQPPSVFNAPRTRHSQKPAIVREAIEKMYPDFDETTRLELFARQRVNGWACDGFESQGNAAA